MMNNCMSAEELKWRARSDARTLAEAEEIKADKKRHAMAVQSANELYAERQRELTSMKKVVTKQPIIGKNNPATVGRL